MKDNVPSSYDSLVPYDASWKHTDPYPTWPFTRVNPKELAKWGKHHVATETDDTEQAPF
jgi:hypothetical protein